jgi:hypothetical protein
MKSYHKGLTFCSDSREYFLNVVRRALDLKRADPISQLCQVRKLGVLELDLSQLTHNG